MTEIDLFKISGIALLEAVLLAIVLLFALKLFRRVLQAVIRRKSFRQAVNRFIPLFEAVIWFLFIYWSLSLIFLDRFYFNLILGFVLAGILFWVFWFAMRDWVAGIILKLQHSYRPGQWIELEGNSGKINRCGLLGLEIVNRKGRVISLPYGSIAGKILENVQPEQILQRQVFRMETSRKKSLEETIAHLRFIIMNAPWSATDKEPEIKLLGEDEKRFKFEIAVHPQRTGDARNIESHLREVAE